MNVEGALGDEIIMTHNDANESIMPVLNKGQKRTHGKVCVMDTKKGDTIKFKTNGGKDNVSHRL